MIQSAIAGRGFSALSMNASKINKPKDEDDESISKTFQEQTTDYFRDKITGIEEISDETGQAAGQVISNQWNRHTESVANNAFNKNVLRNAKGQFVKGSNAAAGQAAQEAVENSAIRKTVGTVGKTVSKGVAGTGIGITLGTAIDLAVGQHTKKFAQETIGKNITEGIVTSGIVGGGLLAAGVIASAPVSMGIIATAAVTIAVGTGVAVLNNWARDNIPAVKNFENDLGDLAVGAYDVVKDTAISAYKNTGKLVGFATKRIGAATSVVASAGKILVDDAALASAIASLNAAKAPLKAIKRENNTIIEEMERALRNAKSEALSIPYITASDVEEVVESHGLAVHYNVKESEINEVNHEIESQLEVINQLIAGIRHTASHARSHDQEWAAKFS